MCTALMPSFALLLKKEMWSKLAKVSWKWPCAILLTAEAAILLHRLYRKYYGKEIMCAECGRARPEFTKVLFFPDPQIPCFEYLLTLQVLLIMAIDLVIYALQYFFISAVNFSSKFMSAC